MILSFSVSGMESSLNNFAKSTSQTGTPLTEQFLLTESILVGFISFTVTQVCSATCVFHSNPDIPKKCHEFINTMLIQMYIFTYIQI